MLLFLLHAPAWAFHLPLCLLLIATTVAASDPFSVAGRSRVSGPQRGNQQQNMLPGIRNPAGLDLLPFRHRDTGPGGQLGQRPAAAQPDGADMLGKGLSAKPPVGGEGRCKSFSRRSAGSGSYTPACVRSYSGAS